jgi:hypothetical protein
VAEFCNPARGNEKGGVESEVGRFRRKHLVPVPEVADFEELNRLLLAACHKDQQRRIGGRVVTVGEGMRSEREYLLPLAAEGFEIAEVCYPIVDEKRRAQALCNWYSMPVRPGTKVRVLVIRTRWKDGTTVSVWRGTSVHTANGSSYSIWNITWIFCCGSRVLGSVPLQQWRENGRWTKEFDRLLAHLIERQGKAVGTRKMIELLLEAQHYGYRQFAEAVDKAFACGTSDTASIIYLLRNSRLRSVTRPPLKLPRLQQYERPLPALTQYDQLLQREVAP